MPKITRLVAGRRDPSRVNLYIDDKFAFSISADVVLARSLARGQTITEVDLATLASQSSQEKLLGKILNFLSYRPRSRKELKDRLRRYLGKDGDPTLVESVLNRLTELGYIDDLSFAQWFVEGRRSATNRSSRHISSELYIKGVSSDIIKEVLSDKSSDQENIKALIAKKSHLEPDKLIAYLARKGFSWDDIKRAMIG